MLDQKGVPLNIEVACCPTARGITTEEIAEFIEGGFIYMDIMPIRREITAKEKFSNPQIPSTATHIAEPMIVFFRMSPSIPPLPGKVIDPGVN